MRENLVTNGIPDLVYDPVIIFHTIDDVHATNDLP